VLSRTGRPLSFFPTVTDFFLVVLSAKLWSQGFWSIGRDVVTLCFQITKLWYQLTRSLPLVLPYGLPLAVGPEFSQTPVL